MLADSDENSYVYDIHGSVTGIVSSSGTKTKSYEYSAFGLVEGETGSETNPWQYCGEYTDSETGLVYLRNRYYDSETGRFVNEDPARSGGNWYVYCNGNPVVFVDKSGLKDVALRSTIESLGGTVSWNSSTGTAKIELDGETAYAYNNDKNGNYIDKNGIMHSDDKWLFKSLAVTFDLGKGWKGRIERNTSGGNYGKRHVHIYNNKESYSQNEDGSPHDGSTGSPPKKIKKELKELKDWDWDANEDNWINSIDIESLDNEIYYINYPNSREVIYRCNILGINHPPSRNRLIEYYTGSTDININIGNNFESVYGPIYSPGAITIPEITPVPVIP